MKWLILLASLTSYLWAKPVVLVSYYDAFDKAPFNNSEKVAKNLEKLMADHPSLSIKLCSLETVFDKSLVQLESCLDELPAKPLMVLGLGETGCELKIEMAVRNMDRTKGPDNDGVERNNSPIIPEAPTHLGLRLPLLQMYCGLSREDRETIEISHNAGSFVCNNTAYQITYRYPELNSGFVHVPGHDCRQREKKNKEVVRKIYQMIVRGAEFLQTEETTPYPHSQNLSRQPVTKNELNYFRNNGLSGRDKCEQEFFKRARGVDEKSFWSFLKTN